MKDQKLGVWFGSKPGFAIQEGLEPVAYAGFSKGGARKFKKFENNEDQNENFPARNKVRFQVKTKKMKTNNKLKLLKTLVQFLAKNRFEHHFCALTFCPSYKGGARHSFAYYSTLIILPWWPKGGAMAQCPPLNTPLTRTAS